MYNRIIHCIFVLELINITKMQAMSNMDCLSNMECPEGTVCINGQCRSVYHGYIGPTGPIGMTGSVGLTGSTGITLPAGTIGATRIYGYHYPTVEARLLELLIKGKIDIDRVKVFLEHQSSKDPVVRDMCTELLTKYENE